ncbi:MULTISPECIES: MFS transporter [Corynebacterium]|uniref:MFS transporter n=1 Tax=Corynebacterium TaxID=1716 RepID=UPI003158C6EE
MMAHNSIDAVAPAEEHVATPHKWRALIILAVGLALIVLDGTIVGVSMPTIIRELNLDLSEAQWVSSVYSVVFAALLLAAGRLGDRYGRRKFFLAGLCIFASGSILAALSSSVSTLIVARVVQGVGGACILPSTLSTTNAMFRGKDRAAAFGVWGAVMSGAAALGPLLGGVITEYAGWEWIFWVNVPLALGLVGAALAWVPDTSAEPIGSAQHSAGERDVLGFSLSAIGFGTLVFGIIEGPKLGWWTAISDFHLGSAQWPQHWPSAAGIALVIAAVSLSGFVATELRRARSQQSVLLDLGMFRYPTFTWGNLTALMVAVGEFALVFVLPLYLVSSAGLSALATGLVLAAMAIGAFLSGAAARHLAARIGAPGVVLVGLGLEVFGTLQLAAEERVGQPLWLVVFALVVYGIGLGLASAQLTSLVLGDIPVAQSGQASATQSTVRQIGSALGAAMAGATLSAALAWKSADFVGSQAQLAEAMRSSAGGTLVGLRQQGAPEEVIAPLARVFAEATKVSLYAAVLCLVIGLLGALMVRRSTKKRP